MESVKERVQKLCKKNGITVQQLEKQLGLSNGTVSKWDRYNPRMDKLQLVADFFSVPADYITGNSSDAAIESGLETIEAVGTYEVDLLKTYRKLTEIGRMKVYLYALQELKAETDPADQKEDASLSTSKVG